LASSHPVLIGQQGVQAYDDFLDQAMEGDTAVSTPFASVVMMEDDAGQVRTGEPTMYVCAPIRDESFEVIGALALQLRPEREFTQILQLGQVDETGETYAFDRHGLMVSNSRFDHELILLGILADHEDSRSILHIQIRDPEGDMTDGFRPDKRRAEMPLTKMAANAIEGNSGVDCDGYRDYRGVQVVGAWTWMPEYHIGVATEIDQAEAFLPLTILKRTFWILFGLLTVSAVAIFVFTVTVARLQRQARKAAIEAQQLGQYTLEEKLGAGAMGVVYRGHHAMLRRPTAIKLLNADKIDDASIQRFEREVQITCKLNHPSTIQIYDFGRTPEGVFYYAMEYLDGIDLQTLVEEYGPQPGGRVIHILRQACGSLFEAHTQGLVHRDIKPANIMLNRRGGESDVVKVLDFGLVKAIEDGSQAGHTDSGGLTGTPLYMSPEAIQAPMSVDARSDLYGLGAVGYFLLTGKTVFEANSLVELCQKHVDGVPVAPSKRLGKSVSNELEDALLSCLEKTRAKRPQTTRELAHLLTNCPEAKGWPVEKAEAWWGRHERGQSPEDASSDADSTQGQYEQTIDMPSS
jgi:tRNA A-37 threonylcarbamoyl transferase component Bud32